MKKVLIEEIGGTKTLLAQVPAKEILFLVQLIPTGTTWFTRDGQDQNNRACTYAKQYTITPNTTPKEVIDFAREMLLYGTFMGGLESIRDPRGDLLSVEEFCSTYDRIPDSPLSPPVYLLVPRTYTTTDEQLQKMLDSKLEQLRALRPVSPELVAKMLQQLHLEYTHASCHIEGNPLRRSETTLVVTKMLSIAEHSHRNDPQLPPSQTKVINKPLIQLLDDKNLPVDLSTDPRLKDLSEQSYVKVDFEEVKNHKLAIEEFLVSVINRDRFPLDVVKQIHRRLMTGILASAGEYRDLDVRVSKSSFVNPPFAEVPNLMNMFINELNSKIGNLHPVLLAAWAHDVLVRIHPFEDGNGRSARILMNVILIHFGYPISFWPEQLEDVYWSACELAHVRNDLTHINRIVCEAVNHSLDIYLATFRGDAVIVTSIQATTPPSNTDKHSLFF